MIIAAFPILLVVAYFAGTVAIRRGDVGWAEETALRICVGLVIFGTLLFALGLAHQLRPLPVALLAMVILIVGAIQDGRRDSAPRSWTSNRALFLVLLAGLVPFWVLSLYPPSAFDETLYHLPTVERFARSGAMPFIPELRAPVFPHLQEVLAVPLFFLGTAAPHALSLCATLVTALLLYAAARSRFGELTAVLAVALFLSSPIVVSMATSIYVEAMLVMFIMASLYCATSGSGSRLDAVLAGAFSGAACSVKYLGIFWAGVAFVLLVVSSRERRWRNGLLFLMAAALITLPWYGRIVYYTGNPLFPFLTGLFGHTVWDGVMPHGVSLGRHALWLIRLPWDVVVARDHAGYQPPFSVWLLLLFPFVIWRSRRDGLTALVVLLCIAWGATWTWLPKDSRYLVVLIPLLSLPSAKIISGLLERWRLTAGSAASVALAMFLLSPGVGYAAYRAISIGGNPLSEPEGTAVRNNHAYGGISFLERDLRGDGRAYVCRAEELTFFLHGRLLGDETGPGRYSSFRPITDPAILHDRLQAAGVKDLMLLPSRCRFWALASDDWSRYFQLVYRDDYSLVFRLTRNDADGGTTGGRFDGSAATAQAALAPSVQ